MKVQAQPAQKNTRGALGPICNNCGGFGFTLSLIGGGSGGCKDCNQTGIAQPSAAELQSQINSLAYELQGLKNIILDNLKGKT